MSKTLSTYERMKRMFEHKEADRVPIIDSPWSATIERWRREGLPKDMSFVDFFGLDKIVNIGVDNSPRYPVEIIEETEEYKVYTSRWGVTLKQWKHSGGVPEFLHYTVKDPKSWEIAKERMVPTPDRIDWDHLKRNYANWRKEGAWIKAHFWFGFDVTHAWMVGTERLLMAMIEKPEWVVDMFNHYLDVDIALFDMIWEAGYHFDELNWPDDMGYKQAQFFSLSMYRELLRPVHERAAKWAHNKGLKVRLHSCGDVRPFIPDLIDLGIDMLNPLEVKAGMDPVFLKAEYGDRLAFHGGLNATYFDTPEKMWQEMARIIPIMKENGGYIISSDHSIPQSVSLKDFATFVKLAKELGSYE